VIHRRAQKLLGDYLEGDLEPGQRTRVDGHLDECGECAREARELRQTVSMLRGLPMDVVPPDVADAVMTRIAAGEGRPPRWVRAYRSFGESGGGWALAAGVAALMIAVMLEPVPTLESGGFAVPLAGAPDGHDSARRTAAFAGSGAVLEASSRPARMLDEEVERLLQRDDSESLARLMSNTLRVEWAALGRGSAGGERRLRSVAPSSTGTPAGLSEGKARGGDAR
jgi:anti-sigma factor RsiW